MDNNNSILDKYWDEFLKSGKINDYLKYKMQLKKLEGNEDVEISTIPWIDNQNSDVQG